MSLKMSRKLHQKWGPFGGQNEIASLRHFLPRTHYVNIFFAALGPHINLFFFARFLLEVFLAGLSSQKRVKTLGFLRFLKRLFEAPDGLLGSSWPFLV